MKGVVDRVVHVFLYAILTLTPEAFGDIRNVPHHYG